MISGHAESFGFFFFQGFKKTVSTDFNCITRQKHQYWNQHVLLPSASVSHFKQYMQQCGGQDKGKIIINFELMWQTF